MQKILRCRGEGVGSATGIDGKKMNASRRGKKKISDLCEWSASNLPVDITHRGDPNSFVRWKTPPTPPSPFPIPDVGDGGGSYTAFYTMLLCVADKSSAC